MAARIAMRLAQRARGTGSMERSMESSRFSGSDGSLERSSSRGENSRSSWDVARFTKENEETEKTRKDQEEREKKHERTAALAQRETLSASAAPEGVPGPGAGSRDVGDRSDRLRNSEVAVHNDAIRMDREHRRLTKRAPENRLERGNSHFSTAEIHEDADANTDAHENTGGYTTRLPRETDNAENVRTPSAERHALGETSGNRRDGDETGRQDSQEKQEKQEKSDKPTAKDYAKEVEKSKDSTKSESKSKKRKRNKLEKDEERSKENDKRLKEMGKKVLDTIRDPNYKDRDKSQSRLQWTFAVQGAAGEVQSALGGLSPHAE